MALGLLAISGFAQAQSSIYSGSQLFSQIGGTCSAGFNLKKTNGNSNEVFLVIAGHCYDVGWDIDLVLFSPYRREPIGEIDFSTGDAEVTNGIAYDLGLIHLSEDANPTGEVIYDTEFTPYVFGSPFTPLGERGTRLAITEILHTDDIQVGMEVCKTGARSGTTCGEVAELASNGIWISTMCVEPGDSGGAVFAPDRDNSSNLIGTAKALGVIRGHSTLGPSDTRQACEDQGLEGNATFTPLTSLDIAMGETYEVITNKVIITKRNAPEFSLDGDWGADNAQNIYLWSTNPDNINQQWIEIDRGDGYFSYQKFGTTHCIDGDKEGAQDQNIYLWDCKADNHNQHWLKVDVGDGAFKLVKRNSSDFAIDGGNGGSDEQNVELWNSSSTSQDLHWTITPVE